MTAPNGDALLLETRRRAGRIDRMLDMIPARFYLGPESHQLLKSSSSFDPVRAKTTSQLVFEAARAASSAPATAEASSSSQSKKKRKLASGAAAPAAEAKDRSDLRKKLETRIAELREERRRKQSALDKANDKAKANGTTETLGQAPKPQQQKKVASVSSPAAGAADRARQPVADEVETGRLSFTPSRAELPFDASVGRRGAKVQKMRASLRQEEQSARKVRVAEAQGEGEEARKELALKKALQRARGEKVHDDTGKLRKAQKMMDVKKKRGKEKWDSRVEASKATSNEANLKRRDNLANRGSKKKKLAGDKEKLKRDGFEGKRAGYLNSEAP